MQLVESKNVQKNPTSYPVGREIKNSLPINDITAMELVGLTWLLKKGNRI